MAGTLSQNRYSIGDTVRRIRRQKDVMQTEVVELSHGVITQEWLSRLENGKIDNPDPEKLQVIADILGVAFRDAKIIDPSPDEPGDIVSKSNQVKLQLDPATSVLLDAVATRRHKRDAMSLLRDEAWRLINETLTEQQQMNLLDAYGFKSPPREFDTSEPERPRQSRTEGAKERPDDPDEKVA